MKGSSEFCVGWQKKDKNFDELKKLETQHDRIENCVVGEMSKSLSSEEVWKKKLGLLTTRLDKGWPLSGSWVRVQKHTFNYGNNETG